MQKSHSRQYRLPTQTPTSKVGTIIQTSQSDSRLAWSLGNAIWVSSAIKGTQPFTPMGIMSTELMHSCGVAIGGNNELLAISKDSTLL
jgi:hypothetical protein